jgi:hypothetical protein
MYFESLQDSQELSPVVTPLSPLLTQRLSPILYNYMKKDPEFAAQVQANLKNYENVAKMRARHLIKA